MTLGKIVSTTSEWLRPLRNALESLAARNLFGAMLTREASSHVVYELYAIAGNLQALEEDVANLAFAPAAAEQSSFDAFLPPLQPDPPPPSKATTRQFVVTLTSVGPNRLLVMKALRRHLAISLADLSSLESRLPRALRTYRSQTDAEGIRAILAGLGADTSIAIDVVSL